MAKIWVDPGTMNNSNVLLEQTPGIRIGSAVRGVRDEVFRDDNKYHQMLKRAFVQNFHSAIHLINHYPMDKYYEN